LIQFHSEQHTSGGVGPINHSITHDDSIIGSKSGLQKPYGSGIGRKGSQQLRGTKPAAGGPKSSIGGATGITAMSSSPNKNKGGLHATQVLNFSNAKNSHMFNHS